MGAESYDYLVPYDEDIQHALDKLRERVFAAGEYNGAELNPSSPEEAFANGGADGTRSILDIMSISPEVEFCCAAPFSEEELQDYFGTDKPTVEHLHDNNAWEAVDRGQARYIVLYEGDKPKQIYFMGYSFD